MSNVVNKLDKAMEKNRRWLRDDLKESVLPIPAVTLRE
jgi:hypothetical protein